ncbi:hypothetical protein [Paraburkholderia gardini]|uniref:hypothetical protein n=1 Tax=Paraburkholderia gardini TaxID=2823469 RepID=UPI001E5C8631|nr:hypothetical protein [Paraburkholderia gardini]
MTAAITARVLRLFNACLDAPFDALVDADATFGAPFDVSFDACAIRISSLRKVSRRALPPAGLVTGKRVDRKCPASVKIVVGVFNYKKAPVALCDRRLPIR